MHVFPISPTSLMLFFSCSLLAFSDGCYLNTCRMILNMLFCAARNPLPFMSAWKAHIHPLTPRLNFFPFLQCCDPSVWYHPILQCIFYSTYNTLFQLFVQILPTLLEIQFLRGGIYLIFVFPLSNTWYRLNTLIK